jgi:nucleotide-binding universal stress UspA family protein
MNEDTASTPHALLKRIVVGTDYSPAARRAVWHAGRLARQHQANLHIVHAQPDWNLFSRTISGTPEQFNAVAAHAEEALRRELAWLEAELGVHARGENRTGRASEVLRSVIREREPHLVIAGARGEHEVPEMAPLLGGTALKLLAFSPVPTLIVRGPAEPYRTALAAVEGSGEGARHLIRWVHTLVSDGECHIVHAFDVPYAQRLRAHGMDEAGMHECQANARKCACAVLDELIGATGTTDVRMHAHLIRGEAVGAVLGEIANRKPDVVILGRHQHPRRELNVATLGSVALRVAYHAPGDVLIVP